MLETLDDERRYMLAESIVEQLSERCRELLRLFYTTRLKLREIAATMNYASEQSAKNQKYKCLETAREQSRLVYNGELRQRRAWTRLMQLCGVSYIPASRAARTAVVGTMKQT